MESTLELIQQSIAKKLEVDVATIKPESTLEELGLDSLDTFDLIFEAEDKLGIKVPNDEVAVKTIQDMVNLLDKLIQEQKKIMTSSSTKRRVVVTGLGVVSPLGNSIDTFFSSIIEGRSGIKRIESDFIDKLDVKIAAQAHFKGEEHFTKQELALLDRVSQFAVFAARQAADDAKLDFFKNRFKKSKLIYWYRHGGSERD